MNVRFGVNKLHRNYLLLSLSFLIFTFHLVILDSAHALTIEERSKFMTFIDKSAADSGKQLALEIYPHLESGSDTDQSLTSKINKIKVKNYRNAMEYISQMLIKDKNYDADAKELESLFLKVNPPKIFNSISVNIAKELLKENAELKESPEEKEFIKNFKSSSSKGSDDELIKSIIELRRKDLFRSLGPTNYKYNVRLEELYTQVYGDTKNIKNRGDDKLDFKELRQNSLEIIRKGISTDIDTGKIRDELLQYFKKKKLADIIEAISKHRNELLLRIKKRFKNEDISLLYKKNHLEDTLHRDGYDKGFSKQMLQISDEEHKQFLKDIGPLLKEYVRIENNLTLDTNVTSAPDPDQLLQIMNKLFHEGSIKLVDEFMDKGRMQYAENLLSTGSKIDKDQLEKAFDENHHKDTQRILYLLAQNQAKFFSFAKHFFSDYIPDSSKEEIGLNQIKTEHDQLIDHLKNHLPSRKKDSFEQFLSKNGEITLNVKQNFGSKVMLNKMKVIEDKYKNKIDSIMNKYYGVDRKKGLNFFQKRSLANELKVLTQMQAQEESAQISYNRDVSTHFLLLSKEYVLQNDKKSTPEERKKGLNAEIEFFKKYDGEFKNNEINQQKRPQRLMQKIKNESEMKTSGCGLGNADINLRDKGFSMENVPEQDQQNLGTCYANASVQAFQALLQSTGQVKKEGINLSAYITALETGKGGSGGNLKVSMDLLLKTGACKYEHFEGPIKAALQKMKQSNMIGDFDKKVEEIYQKYYIRYISTEYSFMNKKVENKGMVTDELKVALCSYLTSISAPEVLADYVMKAVAKMPDSVVQSNFFKFELFNCPQNERVTMDNSFKDKVKLRTLSNLEPYMSIKNRQKMKKEIDHFLNKKNPQPIALGMCSGLFKRGSGYVGLKRDLSLIPIYHKDSCLSHAVLITGRKVINGKCYYMVTNSLKDACSVYHPDLQVYCKKNEVAVESTDLINNIRSMDMYDIQESRSEENK